MDDAGTRGGTPSSGIVGNWDLVAGVALVGLAWCCLAVPGLRASSVRVLVGLCVALFAPGYALLAALATDLEEHPAAGVERAVLAVGLSVAVSMAVGAVLGAPGVLSPVTVLVTLSGIIVGGLAVASVRRPGDWRPSVPGPTSGSAALRARLPTGSDDGDTSVRAALLWVVLVVGLVGGLGGVGYLTAVHQPDGYTEFALRNASGDGIATGNVTDGVVVHLENHERARISYTVVAVTERVVEDGGAVTVTDRRELRRFTATVDRGGEWHARHDPDVAPGHRVAYLLYSGEAPPDPTRETATLVLHYWVEGGNATVDGDDAEAVLPDRRRSTARRWGR